MGEYVLVGGGKFSKPDCLWFEEEDPALKAEALVQACRYIEYRQGSIHDGHRKHAELVLGYVPPAMQWTQQQGAVRKETQTTKNVARSVCDTATALIAKTMPKPTVVTDGADWEVQHRAMDMDRFLVGSYSRAKVYPVAQSSFRDCTMYGTGTWRLVEHGSGKNYWIENVRCNIDDIIVDEDECPADPTPENFYHRQLMPVNKVIRKWGQKDPERIRKIRDAAGKPVLWANGRMVPKDRVIVVEGWHAECDGEPGAYAAAIDGLLLESSGWQFDWFPFVTLYWSMPASGFYGDGVAYRQFGRQKRINYLYRWVQRCQDLISNPRVWIDATNGPLKVQISNEIGEVVSTRGRDPVFQSPQAVNVEMYSWIDTLERGGFEDEGISQFSAQNELPKGIESAPAQREYSFKEGSRFAPVSQRWENAVARENAYKTLELYKANGYDSEVQWSDRSQTLNIPWSEVELDKERYMLRVEASSLESLSPAGRLQAVIELAQTGWLEPEEGRRLLGHPDLVRSQEMDTAPEDYAQFVASQLSKGVQLAPNPYADNRLVKKACKSAYLRATMKPPAPKRIQNNILDYMRALDDLLAPPPGATMPGMPGMPPGETPIPGAAGPGLPVQAITPAAATGAIPLAGKGTTINVQHTKPAVTSG